MNKSKYLLIKNPDKIDLAEWKDFIEKNNTANAFHTNEFVNFFSGIKNFDIFFLAIKDEFGKLQGLLTGTIQRENWLMGGAFSSRAVIYGGPVINETNEHSSEILELLLSYLNAQISAKAIYTEFRNLSDYSQFKNIFIRNGFEFKDHLNFIVNCNDKDSVKKKISNSKIRQVNSSFKEGATIIENPDERQILDFHKILKNLYKVKIKKPLPSKDFFIQFDKSNLGKYLLVEYKSEIIGGIVCPVLDNRVIYEWYIAGEDRKYKNIYPSVLATWAAIDYANRNQIKYFDFMGAGKPGGNYGVREFKSKFGGQLVEYGRFIRINKKGLYKVGKLGLKFYKIFF